MGKVIENNSAFACQRKHLLRHFFVVISYVYPE